MFTTVPSIMPAMETFAAPSERTMFPKAIEITTNIEPEAIYVRYCFAKPYVFSSAPMPLTIGSIKTKNIIITTIAAAMPM